MSHREGPSVRDNGLRDNIIVDTMRHVEFGTLLDTVGGDYVYKVG
jgi:hypothetical protein